MTEILTTIGASALLLYAVLHAAAWALHGRSAGRQERALFVRWAVYNGLLLLAVTCWVVAGVAVFLYGAEFWRGAYVGGSAVVWLGYAPALVWLVRAARRRQAAVRAAEFGSGA